MVVSGRAEPNSLGDGRGGVVVVVKKVVVDRFGVVEVTRRWCSEWTFGPAIGASDKAEGPLGGCLATRAVSFKPVVPVLAVSLGGDLFMPCSFASGNLCKGLDAAMLSSADQVGEGDAPLVQFPLEVRHGVELVDKSRECKQVPADAV